MNGAGAAVFSEASLAAVEKARANIDAVRKRDVELRVVDRRGQAVAGLKVEVVQKRHAFCFGDNLWSLDRLFRFGEADRDTGRYFRRRYADLLNAANALCYWTERPRNDGPKTEDRQGFPALEGFHACVDWAASQGLTVKGHPLFWSIPKCVPDWVQRYDHDTQWTFAEVRVRSLVASVRGRVAIWDAVNEPLWETAFRDLPRRHWPHLTPIEDIADYVEPVLRWAREEDPDACYLVNDYGLQPGGRDADPPCAADGTKVTSALQRERFARLIECLRGRGAPPDAIGLQSHTGGWTDHATQWAVYDELAAAGLPLHVTEFWAHTKHLAATGKYSDEQLDEIQAEYVVNTVTTAFGHPAMDAFFFWGLMDGAVRWGEHSSHELTDLYHRMWRLLHEEWTTRERRTTDAAGRVGFRGFLGDYALRFRLPGGQPAGRCFRVDRQAAMPLTVTL